MGCKENSDLVNELSGDNHINTQKVERALRLVDRGIFVTPRQSSRAYNETPFRTENLHPGQIHISAPSIYTNVLEFLDLHKGQSFLNVGSGSGYLSTIVGYFLGENGLNHGVELHSNVFDHAQESVHIFFSQKFVAGYDWCRPEFVHGNAYLLKDISKKYDRIYVGAQVEQSHVAHFSEMLKEGGIMVIPTKLQTETHFQQVKRTSEGFETEDFMNVTFAELVHPSGEGYRAETPREIVGRKRKHADDTNPNECVTEDLLALFKPRSLEMLASCAIRKRIGDTLRMTHPIAIVQRETPLRESIDVIVSTIRRHRRLTADRAEAQNEWNILRARLPPNLRRPGIDVRPLPLLDDEEQEALNFHPHRVFDNEALDQQRLDERQEAMFNMEMRAAAERGVARWGEDEEEAIIFHPEFMNIMQREVEAREANQQERRENEGNDSSSSSDSNDDDNDGEGAEDSDDGGPVIVGINDPLSSSESEAEDTEPADGFDAVIRPPPDLGGDIVDFEELVRQRRAEAEAEGAIFDEHGLLAHLREMLTRQDDEPQLLPNYVDLIDEIDDEDRDVRMPAFRRIIIGGSPRAERKRNNCRVCPRSSICRCYGVPSLREMAKTVVTFRLSTSASMRLTKNTPWMRRLERLNGVCTKVRSFADQIPGILEEDAGPPLPNGRQAIEDWSTKQKIDKFYLQIAFLKATVRKVGQIQFRQEIGDFKKEDLAALSECDKVEKMTFKNEEDSILRFEKELVRIIDQLPLPPNGKAALKWNLYRNS